MRDSRLPREAVQVGGPGLLKSPDKHGGLGSWFGCDQVLPIPGPLWVSWPNVAGGRLKEDPVPGC